MKITQKKCLFERILVRLAIIFVLADQPSLRGTDEVIGVRLPSYDSLGRLLWEISAAKVELIEEDSYYAQNPTLSILENRRATTTAQSTDGYFDVNQRTAKGGKTLEVSGNGFTAFGRPWTFEQNEKDDSSRLSFSEYANIGFDYELGSHFAGLPQSRSSSGSESFSGKTARDERADPSAKLEDFPTTAWAKRCELIDLGNGKHRFLLDGETEIRMEMEDVNGSGSQITTITCDQAIMELVDDKNQSNGIEIKRVEASGDVVVKQPTRTCTAGTIEWEEDGRGLVLEGNAKVYDVKWGKAEGAKIILRKEDGRAEVVGGEGRSKLSIPISPKFKFPK